MGRRRLKDFIDKTMIRFLVVGVINTIVGTGTMFFLYNVVGCNYWVSSAGNYVVGSIVSYFLNKYFTFQNRTRSFAMIVKFIANISLCYLIAYGAAKPVIRWLLSGADVRIQENVAMLFGMCIFVVLNYLGQRFLVFTHSKS